MSPPADIWQWLAWAAGGARDKGLAVYADGRAAHEERRAARLAARAEAQAEAEAQAQADAADEEEMAEDMLLDGDPDAAPGGGFHLGMPAWLSHIFGHGRLPDENGSTEAPPRPESPLQSAAVSHPRAPFDIDLGPDPAAVSDGGSEPIEPIIPGPGGTFGLNPLRPAPASGAPRTEEAAPAAPAAPHVAMYDQDKDDGTLPPAPAAGPGRSPGDPDGAAPAAAGPHGRRGRGRLDHRRGRGRGRHRGHCHPGGGGHGKARRRRAGPQPRPRLPPQRSRKSPQPMNIPPSSCSIKPRRTPTKAPPPSLQANAQKLVDTLESFGVKTRVLDISRGPAVTRYEVQPMAGVKISRITSLADDLALNLAVADIRMEAPIPASPPWASRCPTARQASVSIRSIFESQSFRHMTSPLTIALGKDIAGVAQVADLCKMPHLLIAGSTGSGKSVCVNSIIMSLVFRSGPEDVKLILIDPKVVETG